MSRTIDRVIDYIRELDNAGGMSPTIKQVLINRLDVEPTREELDAAHAQVYGGRDTASRALCGSYRGGQMEPDVSFAPPIRPRPHCCDGDC